MSSTNWGLRTEQNFDAEFSFVAHPPLRNDESPRDWRSVQPGEHPDALVLTAVVPDHILDLVINNVADSLVPVVSLVPDKRRWLDAAGGYERAWDRARFIQARLRELPESTRYSSNAEDILLARMYSRDTDLEASYDSGDRNLVSYPIAGRIKDVAAQALQLFNSGYVTRTFFDRIHGCPDCRSGHLTVREECHKCRSAYVQEEVMVHHFRCGHSEPEFKFRTGRGYECPKCGHMLRHIGLDYDKPGTIVRCLDCGDVNDLPAVGFKCIDCGNHHDSEQVPAVTWYSFKLTARGNQRVLGNIGHAVNSGGVDTFRVLLEHVQREEHEFKTPYQVMRMHFLNADDIRRKSGRAWEQTHHLVMDALNSALRAVDLVREENGAVLILMPRTDAKSAYKAMEHIRARLRAILKFDLKVDFELVQMPQPDRAQAPT